MKARLDTGGHPAAYFYGAGLEAAMRVLVTGASGFVGRHLVPRLLREGEVVALHRPGLPVPAHLKGCAVARGDILRPASLPRADVDAVIHLAAEASPQRCERYPRLALRTNVEGTQAMLQWAASHAKRFVLASTAQVYAPAGGKPLTEDHPRRPVTYYGATKLAAEALTLNAHDRGAVEACVVRPFNMYGPGQGGAYIVPTILAQVREGREVRVRSGRPVRDFLYVGDAVDLFALAATHPKAAGEAFNAASGRSVPIGELARAAIRAGGRRLPFVSEDRAAPHKEADAVHADAGKAKRLLGWSARTPLPDGLRATLAER
ncbi:MAG TPA: NAD(P)-dependent oxidoreductase [Candidatus Thermoplasmatota archaeon]|nr:NAD(P)-dependent oxidoreductase [Candidatus Thermoplasmatota archaeon]